MEELKFFIYALEEALANGSHLVAMYQKVPAVINAYKTHIITVVEYGDKGKETICEIRDTVRSVTDDENTKVVKRLAKEAVKKVLRHYGVGVQ